MNERIERTLMATIKTFSDVSRRQMPNIQEALIKVFNSQEPFLEKVSAMDQAIDAEPALNELREVFFDLLLVNFFACDLEKLGNTFLNSKEWESAEEATLHRGTAVFDLLLYLRACEDEDVAPDLQSYLVDFLEVNKADAQDEQYIYSDLIAHQDAVESSVEEIAQIARNLPEDAEMKNLFYPIYVFFYEQDPSPRFMEVVRRRSSNPRFDVPVYAMLVEYNN